MKRFGLYLAIVGATASLTVSTLTSCRAQRAEAAVEAAASPDPYEYVKLLNIDSADSAVFRFHDPRSAVTCWAMVGMNGRSGLSCIPDKEIHR